jgi:MoaA/NifB/PqqE/SkfB family radical SAM enzyme
MMEHIDFHISYRCPNKCLFCSSADSIKKCRNHPLKAEDILQKLKKNKKNGFRSVNFTGGEPTILPFFPSLVKETKRLGYRIYIGTNGGRFENRRFSLETAPFLDEVCFSCHGHTPGIHNFLTVNKIAFKRLNKAMDNLSKFSIRFSSNTVVTKFNIDCLEKALNFVIERQIKQALISNLAPEGRGLANYDKLAVRLSDLKNKIPALIKMANKNNIIIRFFGLPACVLGSFACYSNDFCWDGRLNIEQEKNKIFFLKEERCLLPIRGRIKTAKCRSCLYGKICGGIFEEYFKRFGDEELLPFRR